VVPPTTIAAAAAIIHKRLGTPRCSTPHSHSIPAIYIITTFRTWNTTPAWTMLRPSLHIQARSAPGIITPHSHLTPITPKARRRRRSLRLLGGDIATQLNMNLNRGYREYYPTCTMDPHPPLSRTSVRAPVWSSTPTEAIEHYLRSRTWPRRKTNAITGSRAETQ